MLAISHIRVHRVGEASVVELRNRALIEGPLLQELGKYLCELVDRQGHTRIILDFSKVQFLASSGLAILVELRQKLEYLDGQLLICGLRNELKQVFRFAHLDNLFLFHATREEALAVLASAAGR